MKRNEHETTHTQGHRTRIKMTERKLACAACRLFGWRLELCSTDAKCPHSDVIHIVCIGVRQWRNAENQISLRFCCSSSTTAQPLQNGSARQMSNAIFYGTWCDGDGDIADVADDIYVAQDGCSWQFQQLPHNSLTTKNMNEMSIHLDGTAREGARGSGTEGQWMSIGIVTNNWINSEFYDFQWILTSKFISRFSSEPKTIFDRFNWAWIR